MTTQIKNITKIFKQLVVIFKKSDKLLALLRTFIIFVEDGINLRTADLSFKTIILDIFNWNEEVLYLYDYIEIKSLDILPKNYNTNFLEIVTLLERATSNRVKKKLKILKKYLSYVLFINCATTE